jgi:iron complex transport system substrate-binding protein
VYAPRHPERPGRGRVAGLIRLVRPTPTFPFVVAALFAAIACRPEPSRELPGRGAARPKRVVALAPNLTEIVFALGAGSSLVGVSEHSDFPPEARTIPRVGGLDVSAEKVASLSPDLVLATREGNARGPVSVLEKAGLSVVVLPTGSLDAVLEGIRIAGDALDRREEAARLAGELFSRRAAVRGHVTGRPRPKTILLVWPDPPQAAGGGTFLDDVLSEAGGENLLGNRPGWPVVSAEYLTTAPVEVFVFPASAANRPAFERALASGALSRGTSRRARVIWSDESALTRPGPRVFDALEDLARALHSEPEKGKGEPVNDY